MTELAPPRRRRPQLRRPVRCSRTSPSTWRRPDDRLRAARNGAGKTTTMRIILGVLAAGRRRGHAGRRPADPARPPPLRLHAGGARPLPEDDGPRAARLPGPAARDADAATPTTRADDAARAARARRARATTRWRRCRWATSSAPRSPPRWCTTPRCWCSTSRSPGSTRWPSTPSWRCCGSGPPRGVPVLFSSHQLDVVERLCDDLVIIADGGIRAAGSREELRAHALRAALRAGGRARRRLAARPARRDSSSTSTAPRAVFDLAPGTDDQPVLRRGPGAAAPVRAFRPVSPVPHRDLPRGRPE